MTAKVSIWKKTMKTKAGKLAEITAKTTKSAMATIKTVKPATKSTKTMKAAMILHNEDNVTGEDGDNLKACSEEESHEATKHQEAQA